MFYSDWRVRIVKKCSYDVSGQICARRCEYEDAKWTKAVKFCIPARRIHTLGVKANQLPAACPVLLTNN